MNPRFDELLAEYQQAMSACRELYVGSGRFCATQYPELVPDSPEKFVALMDDLHRGLLVKTYISIAEADRNWSSAERRLAQELVFHVWDKRLEGSILRQTLQKLSEKAIHLKWYGLVRPFSEIEPLRDRIGDLETIVIRLANLVAKADGRLRPAEAKMLHSLQEELDHHLKPIPFAEHDHQAAQQVGTQAVAELRAEASELRKNCDLTKVEPPPLPADAAERPSLEEAKAELARLIGMATVKHEIDSLTNYILLQRKRVEAGLPETGLSLHTVFSGNPGTGKTTVARIVGRILGALGILEKGHIIETDRSGLVAEYAGQTGPKTNQRIDEAIDGILFIDEAYTLIAERNDDPYGHEAVQTLLKRMEDDRDRLVVILAGYPEPITRLLRANPGLRSRCSRNVHFEDYTPVELGRILELMCTKNRYQLPALARAKFLAGVTWLYNRRDEYFGNGRLVRNLFEDTIRHLANRIADVSPITKELLTRIDPEDLVLPQVPNSVLAGLEHRRFRVSCPGCARTREMPADYLGRRVKCPCGTRFKSDWGECVAGN